MPEQVMDALHLFHTLTLCSSSVSWWVGFIVDHWTEVSP